MSETTITIFGKEIPAHYQEISIYKLKYFEENPRVFSCVFGEDKPDDDDKLQDFIQIKMLEQPSVKNLIPEIEKHGGLLEPILVRYDTNQVIEGNSRLAAFRFLNKKAEKDAEKSKKSKDEKWITIACHCVSNLTETQQDAYLAQIHIKGKTQWSAYEKANFAYIRKKRGVSVKDISVILSETPSEIGKQIKTVGLMETNNDKEKSHFSYYDVLVRNREIKDCTPDVKNFLLSKIKNMGVEESEDNDFTAAHLRDKFPAILAKKKELKKFIEGKSTLDDAYQNARPSNPRQKVKTAKDKIMDINKPEIDRLEKREVDALLADTKKLSKEVKRVQSMVEKIKEEKQQDA